MKEKSGLSINVINETKKNENKIRYAIKVFHKIKMYPVTTDDHWKFNQWKKSFNFSVHSFKMYLNFNAVKYISI